MEENDDEILIDEKCLEIDERIDLYKELIRLLEKDIDEAQNIIAKKGISLWALVGAIAASLVFLFSQTRDLVELPIKTVDVFVTIYVSLLFLFGALNVVGGVGSMVKKGRVIEPKRAFKGIFASFAVRSIFLSGVSILILQLDLGLVAKTLSLFLLLLPSAYFFVSYGLFRATERMLGNNEQLGKVPMVSAIMFLVCYLVPIFLLGSNLDLPVGSVQTAAYTVGAPVALTLFLAELLVAISIPSTKIGDLRDLKDDIIFRRLDLNAALTQYKILTEGKSVHDQMRFDFQQIIKCLDREEEILNEQSKILGRLHKHQINPPNDGEEEQIAEEIEILSNSYRTYERELTGLFATVSEQVPAFSRKLSKTTAASGDLAASNQLVSRITSRIQTIDQIWHQVDEKRLNVLRRSLDSGETD